MEYLVVSLMPSLDTMCFAPNFFSDGSVHKKNAQEFSCYHSCMDPQSLLEKAQGVSKELKVPLHTQTMPDVPYSCASLRGKKILLVDDDPHVISTFLLPLLAATDGNAHFVLHRTESMEELTEKILALQPDLVLIDEYLSHSVRGHVLAAAILQKNVQMKCVGFSNATSPEALFRTAGAGFVYKDVNDPWESLQAVSSAL